MREYLNENLSGGEGQKQPRNATRAAIFPLFPTISESKPKGPERPLWNPLFDKPLLMEAGRDPPVSI